MAEPIHSGKVLGGRYSLGARLGSGGWGSVYAAVQTDLGRPVAIKVLHTNVALSSEGLARFEREAKAAAALGHPNIAQVSDFQANNAGEPPFLVMEMLTGGTLGAALEAAPGRRIAPARMAWITYQILAGLDVAHRAGIVHRDIKPDNVFLVAMPGVEDYVKLLDFGIAKLSGDANAQLTASGTMLGSPAFMAPEQVKTNHFDHRVDLYAVGATMYLALSGRMPFDATTLHGLLLAITEEVPVPLHELDPTMDHALSMLVGRAMNKDPAARFASAEEMRHALEPWLGGTAAHASAPAHANANAARRISPASSTAAVGAVPGGAPVQLGLPASGPPIDLPPPGSPNYGAFTNSPYGQSTSPPYGQVTSPPYGQVTSPPYGGVPSPAHGANSARPALGDSNTPAHVAPATSSPVANSSLHYGSSPGASMPQPAQAVMAPAPAASKSSGAVVVLLAAVVVLLLVIVAGGVGVWHFFAGREQAGGTSAAGGTPTTGAGAGAGAGASGAGGAPAALSTAASGALATSAPTSGGPAGSAGAKARAPGAAGVGSAGAPAGVASVPGGAAAASVPGGAAAASVPGGAKKQFAGTIWRIGGGSFGPFEIDPSKAAIMRVSGPISGCFASTELDAPDHQFTDWTFQVDPAGNVKSVRRTTDFEPHPKFDACMIGALRQVKWAPSKAGGSPHVNFTARTRDNP